MYYEVNEFILFYSLFVFTIFSISSAILYSEIVIEWKNSWIKYWINSKYFKKLQYYGLCQLCLSLPISLSLEWFFLPYEGIPTYILFAISTCGLSWLLGSITLMCLNAKWAFEEYAKYRNVEFKRKTDDLK